MPRRNYTRQGITIGGVDVVVVAASRADADEVRRLTERAVRQHGVALLHRSGHALFHGDPVLTAPVCDERGRLLGYVELAE